MNVSDILILIHESLNEHQQTALEEAMRRIDGVIAPRFASSKTPHLLFVAFNPDLTNTANLFDTVKACGYTAQLIGM